MFQGVSHAHRPRGGLPQGGVSWFEGLSVWAGAGQSEQARPSGFSAVALAGDAQMLQAQGVTQREGVAADQDHGPILRWRQTLAAQFFSNQQARQITGQLGRAQAVKQAQGAHSKQVVQHAARMLALVHALQKSRNLINENQ